MVAQAARWFCLRVWYSWLPKRTMWCPSWGPVKGPVTPQLAQKRVDLGWECGRLNNVVEAAVALDFAAYAGSKALALVDAAMVGN